MMQEILLAYRDLSLSKKATIWFFVCSILQRGIITVTMPILTRLLTTEEFGRVSVFTSWLSIIQIHYFFMMKICKDHMAGVKPYKVNVLLLISGIFVGLGLLYIPTYTDTFVRYTITGILLFAILTNKRLLGIR